MEEPGYSQDKWSLSIAKVKNDQKQKQKEERINKRKKENQTAMRGNMYGLQMSEGIYRTLQKQKFIKTEKSQINQERPKTK